MTLGLERSIYRLYHDCKTIDEVKTLLGTIFISQVIIATLILTLLLLVPSTVNLIFVNISFYPYFIFTIAFSYFSLFGLVVNVYYQVIEKASNYIYFSLSQFAVSTVLILYFVVYQKQSAQGMLLGYVVSNLIFVPIFIFVIRAKINFTISGKLLKSSLSFSLPYIPVLLSSWIINLSDRVFLEHFQSLDQVGIFSLGYQISSIGLIFSSAIHQAYSPFYFKFANKDTFTDTKLLLIDYNHKIVVANLVLALFVALFANEFISLFINKNYANAKSIITILCISMFFGQSSSIFNLSFQQAKKTTYQFYVVFLSVIISICLNILLIPRIGLLGAAISSLISYIAYFVFGFILSKKTYYVPLRKTILVIYFSIVLLILYLNSIVNFPIISSLVGKIILLSLLLYYLMKTEKINITNLLKSFR